MNNFGFKELYDVSLKTTYPIDINGRTIETGETIAVFDKIQLATITEHNDRRTANGGYDNRPLIWWEETKEITLRLTQGVFSKSLFAIMSNASLIESAKLPQITINTREIVETDERGVAPTKKPIVGQVFVYDAKTGEKITGFSVNTQWISTSHPFREVIIDYWYRYTGAATAMIVGRPLTSGYLSLSGKTRVKDEITGQIKTGIINIPKLKLMSDLSMRLGEDATPIVGTMEAVAIPVGNRGEKKVMEILFLDDDIDSDI